MYKNSGQTKRRENALNCIAERVIGVCAKDLIYSEAKYYASCYKGFCTYSVCL